jgi:RHS repeat-associated protein
MVAGMIHAESDLEWALFMTTVQRLQRAADGNITSTQYGYQSNGRVAGLWDHRGGYDPSNSTWPGGNISSRFYGYAPDDQVTWSARASDGGASGSALENNAGENYGYNPDHSISAFGYARASTDQSDNNQGDSNASAANLSATTGAVAPNSYGSSYTYDASGNRSQVTEFGISFGYIADGENRYEYSTYDANGNTTNSVVGWTYAYDAEGRMTTATNQSNNAVMTFGYDGLNRLIYQGWAGMTPTIFCYAGNQRIEERAQANNAPIYRYFYDSPTTDWITFRQTSNGGPGGGTRLYYQYDAQGNTTHVSNDAGQVVEQYLYDAYGTPYVYNAAGTFINSSNQDNRYLFHGASAYEWLASPGLYYCRNRMYLPYHGRWLQPDPIGFAGGDVNIYRYCGNDPIDNIDPSGDFFSEIGGAFGAVTGAIVGGVCGSIFGVSVGTSIGCLLGGGPEDMAALIVGAEIGGSYGPQIGASIGVSVGGAVGFGIGAGADYLLGKLTGEGNASPTPTPAPLTPTPAPSQTQSPDPSQTQSPSESVPTSATSTDPDSQQSLDGINGPVGDDSQGSPDWVGPDSGLDGGGGGTPVGDLAPEQIA